MSAFVAALTMLSAACSSESDGISYRDRIADEFNRISAIESADPRELQGEVGERTLGEFLEFAAATVEDQKRQFSGFSAGLDIIDGVIDEAIAAGLGSIDGVTSDDLRSWVSAHRTYTAAASLDDTNIVPCIRAEASADELTRPMGDVMAANEAIVACMAKAANTAVATDQAAGEVRRLTVDIRLAWND